jgi:hypothetical protein
MHFWPPHRPTFPDYGNLFKSAILSTFIPLHNLDGGCGQSVPTPVHIKTAVFQDSLKPFKIKQTYIFAMLSASAVVTVSTTCFTVQHLGISTTYSIFKFSPALKINCNLYPVPPPKHQQATSF